MQRLKDWLAALAIGIAIALVFGSFDQKPNLPDQAPSFALTDLQGDDLVLDEMLGQTVIINFWASWCGPCKQEIPDFSRFAREHPDIAVLGLAVDSGELPDVRRSAQQLGIDYTVAIADRQTVSDYDISAFPTTVVVGPSGEVSHVQVGVMSYKQLNRVTDGL
jgi:thiol-disulfide isomerase/thioredoxin